MSRSLFTIEDSHILPKNREQHLLELVNMYLNIIIYVLYNFAIKTV